MDGVVSGGLEHGSHGVVVGQRLVELAVADVAVPLVASLQERGAGRGADRGGDVVVGQLRPLRGHAVDSGGVELLVAGLWVLPEAPQVAVAEVIDKDVDDVRLSGARGCDQRATEPPPGHDERRTKNAHREILWF